MKKFFLLLTCLLCTSVMMADEKPATLQAVKTENKKDTNFQIINTGDYLDYVKLDTRDGRIWQVTVSIYNPDKRNCEIPINKTPLASNEKPGRFSLHKARENTASKGYILLDDVTGKTWFVVTSSL